RRGAARHGPAQGDGAAAALKRLLRAAAARTADALKTAIGAALGHFTPAESGSYLRHCGYAQSGR
ncbi:MAG TPA: hypothetical protein VGA45_19075, partial [Actinomycetota bacterium]